jgi:WD40 repeat protein
VTGVAFSPDGKRALSGGADLAVILWDVETGRRIRTFTGSQDTLLPATGGSQPAWDWGNPEGSGDSTTTMLVARDAGHLIASPADTLLMDPEPFVNHSRHTCLIKSVAFSPNGGEILFCNEESSFRMFDVASGREVRRFRGHEGCVRSVAFSPDGAIIASGSIATFGSHDNSIRIWDSATGHELLRMGDHPAWVWSVAFSPDGRYIASGGGDNVVRLWDLPLELL